VIVVLRRTLTVLIVAHLLAACGPEPNVDTVQASPGFVLWAWDRPEDVSFIKPGEATVAHLCGTITLDGDHVEVAPRRGQLVYHRDVARVAVVRIEHGGNQLPTLDQDQLRRVLEAIVTLASPSTDSRLQIDYDVTLSNREFYRSLLDGLRKHYPNYSELSITALGSWCLGDRWISDLPVDYAVPMLFRMGPETELVIGMVETHGIKEPLCSDRIGLATDQQWVETTGPTEVWLFHPRPWDRDAWEEAHTRWRDIGSS
jgi:hypothetical protein